MKRQKVLVSKIETALLVLGAFSLLSCAKPADYLYYSAPTQPGQKYSFTQKIKDITGNADVDILTIIDNSPSMDTYQSYLSQNTDLFINSLSSGTTLHWKIGLITTSVGEGPYGGFDPTDEISYTDPMASTKFKTAVSHMGTGGDAIERTYQPVLDSLAKYPNFLRPQAGLVLLLVSDAPEQSSISTSDFVSALVKYKGDVSAISFYGTLDPSDWCPSTDDPFTWSGNKFDELLHLVKGAAYPICDKNFGKNLVDIANRVVKTATSPRIYLEKRPKIETLEVIYRGQSLPAGPKDKGGFWVYSFRLNAVVFHDLKFAPGDLEEVQVNYEEDVGTH